ncbi:hypothetical protein [Roseovarius sp. 217]|uniref:hypothetical protein n=1 Tax=Roseovarius sp. (strain 217) TaxID=314264 RepID=UPI0000687CB7|nr:hypothetical protein [Roseovarius sp. 217]EAQ24588.1 hypothetical protein ROS217_10552 [Roseovarius sp. 217]
MDEVKKSWKLLTPIQWLKKLLSIGSWLYKQRTGWVVVLVSAIALIFPWLLSSLFSTISENWLRKYGLLIQIMGFLLALYGVNSNLNQLGLRSIPARIWEYLREFPILPWDVKRTYLRSAMSGGSSGSSAVSGTVISVGGSLEERLDRLEDDYRKLVKEIRDIDNKREVDKKQILSRFKELERDSETRTDDLRSEFSRVFESAIKIEILGILLFVVGSAYATIPDLMVNLMR